MWRAFFVLRVSLTPLTDYLILPFTAFPSSPFFICFFLLFASSRIPCSIYCLLTYFLASSPWFCVLLFEFFAPSVLLPVLDYGKDLGSEVFGRNGWAAAVGIVVSAGVSLWQLVCLSRALSWHGVSRAGLVQHKIDNFFRRVKLLSSVTSYRWSLRGLIGRCL